MRSLFLIWILLLLASCGQNAAEKTDEAIDVALTYLSSEKCDAAIDVLEDAGRNNSNPVYLQVLASAYACRAHYNAVKFIEDDITTISGTATGLMKSLALLSLSPETTADSDEYKDLRTGLGVLLNIDSEQPSQVRREAKFGARKAGDMGLQTLLLSLVQLGKFTHYYGNVNVTSGVKGGGAKASKCFIAYTDAQALLAVSGGVTGSCTNSTLVGHPDLSMAAADLPVTKRRMCEGLMLVTNVIDVLSNITLPVSDDLGDLDDVANVVKSFRTNITTLKPDLETLLTTTSQAECMSIVSTAPEFDKLQQIYALLFEVGLP